MGRNIRLSLMKGQEQGIIAELAKDEVGMKLMEMGFLVGEKIKVIKIAPLGDPMSIKIAGYLISLRKDEAEAVLVNMIWGPDLIK